MRAFICVSLVVPGAAGVGVLLPALTHFQPKMTVLAAAELRATGFAFCVSPLAWRAMVTRLKLREPIYDLGFAGLRFGVESFERSAIAGPAPVTCSTDGLRPVAVEAALGFCVVSET